MPTVLSSSEKRRRLWRRTFEFVGVVLLGAGIVLAHHYAQQSFSLGDAFARLVDRAEPPSAPPVPEVTTTYRSIQQTNTDCDIKGNISIKSGERIFHVPGQRDYAETRISPGKGERWFCSEADARAAGWRKAGR